MPGKLILHETIRVIKSGGSRQHILPCHKTLPSHGSCLPSDVHK